MAGKVQISSTGTRCAGKFALQVDKRPHGKGSFRKRAQKYSVAGKPVCLWHWPEYLKEIRKSKCYFF